MASHSFQLSLAILSLLYSLAHCDWLYRMQCTCAPPSEDLSTDTGYVLNFLYHSDRLNLDFWVERACSPSLSPLTADCDTELLNGLFWTDLCSDGSNGHQFCYNKEMFDGDEYNLDAGDWSNLDTDNAQVIDDVNALCQDRCQAWVQMDGDDTGFSYSEYYYDLPQL